MQDLSRDLEVCGIYMITNPIGKSYIGYSVKIRTRLLSHKSNSNTSWGGNSKLMLSIREFGFYNHTFRVLELCEREDLKSREMFFIQKYNTEFTGLNGEYTITKKAKNEVKYMAIAYYPKDINTYGSKEKLKEAIIAVRDLNKEALTEILKK